MPPNPFLAPKTRPLVVGHRGVPLLHQENTLAGFRRAVELGLPAVELDVRLTADRRAVCLHDADLERLTGTSADVADLTWDQVSRLRIRAELPMGVGDDGGAVSVRYERPERIPLLAEVLAEMAGKLAINVELKLSRRRWWDSEVGAIAAGEIARANAQHRVIVTSFDPRKLRTTARARPELAVGFAFDDTMLDFAAPLLDRLPLLATELSTLDRRPHANSRRLLGRILDTGIVGRILDTRVVGADHTLVGPRTVAYMRRRGVVIGTHTLFPLGSTTAKRIDASSSSPAEVDRLVGLGVDWIETDDPERLMMQVHR
ncbi:MAG TPA: glycerophosphodiester phosphodiesterase family protein [Kofleriaceae bacterium]|nr:glycerophosphodiester phosphodiesterase family protein [Kofleriaceae bacterium]